MEAALPCCFSVALACSDVRNSAKWTKIYEQSAEVRKDRNSCCLEKWTGNQNKDYLAIATTDHEEKQHPCISLWSCPVLGFLPLWSSILNRNQIVLSRGIFWCLAFCRCLK